jgi:hypothetical protein
MTKAHILSEIRRTAALNGGKPVGRLRFTAETGIRESDWRGIHWVRWNEALGEAGFQPNQLTTGLSDEEKLDLLALSGHPKSGQSWTGQNRPPEGVETG